MKLSGFGEQFTSGSGILSLMEDLGHALATGGDDMIMMGGGNPGHVPEFSGYYPETVTVSGTGYGII